jgi:AcrR family transcriptional regulator
MRVKPNPKKRIIKKAAELFYLRGFPNTHVGDIIEESNTYKKSFYQYFRDKNHLAEEYLNFQEDRILRNSRKLSYRFENYHEFIRYWMSFNRKLFQGPRFAGCPFANFAIQTLGDKNLFQLRVHNFVKNWENVFYEFLERLRNAGKIPQDSNLHRISKKIILIYEGGIHTYLMSQDMSYLDLAEEEMLDIFSPQKK